MKVTYTTIMLSLKISAVFFQYSSLFLSPEQTFSVKGQILNAGDFVGHGVSVTTTQLCSWSTKSVTDNT